MKNRLCSFCIHYAACKFREELVNLTAHDAVDWMDEAGFRRWLTHFAKYCMYFKLDAVTVDSLMASGLMFLYHEPESIDSDSLRTKAK